MIKKGCIDMKIQAVFIDGFKNLANVRITFDNITTLVALNDFGKSNVLSGIDFGLSFMKASIEDKKDMMSNSQLIPGNCNLIGRNYKYEMEAAADINGREYLVQYGYEFEWKDTDGKEQHQQPVADGLHSAIDGHNGLPDGAALEGLGRFRQQ